MEFYRYQNLFEENGKTARQEYGDINPPVWKWKGDTYMEASWDSFLSPVYKEMATRYLRL
jgi:hypothetical protein